MYNGEPNSGTDAVRWASRPEFRAAKPHGIEGVWRKQVVVESNIAAR